MNRRQLGVLLLLGAGGLAFFGLDLQNQLSLQAVQAGQTRWREWVVQQPVAAGLGYLAVYVAVTALSLPGAAVLTLLGGALFGLFWGVVLASLASTLGASLAFLSARYVLREAVQSRWGHRLAEVNRGIEREGAYYLFGLRLIPLFPFFLINVLMGLSPMRLWTFAWVSQLGMLAGTVVFVNAGTALAQVTRPGDLITPSLLLSLVALALFPWLARRTGMALGAWWQGRRVLAPWVGQRPRRFDRNLIVIGAGAGGLVTAYIAAALKARVTLIEAHRMGGDCLNTGCVPSKALIRASRLAHEMRHAQNWGLTPPDGAHQVLSLPRLMARVQEVIASIEPHDSAARYESLGVEVVAGHARLLDPWTVEVRGDDGSVQRLSGRSIVLATGAEPVRPDLPGLDAVGALNSDTLWTRLAQCERLPPRWVVLGGGAIGCELAQALARLGAKVTLVEAGARLLLREDEDVAERVLRSLEADGVRVLCGTRAQRCEAGPAGRALLVSNPGGGRGASSSDEPEAERLPFDELLCAVGRVARLQGYGLEALGLAGERRIDTNAFLQTRFPHIYAVGDVTGGLQFTHAAAHQAWHAAVNALFGDWKRFAVDTRLVPAATFVDPEVARVGLTEQEARRQGVAYELTRYALEDFDRALVDGEAQGFVKVLTVPGRDRILGVCIVGSHAGDLLAEFVLAMSSGLGLARLLRTVRPYPTWSEANKHAAGLWRQAHAPGGLLRAVARYHDWRRGRGG